MRQLRRAEPSRSRHRLVYPFWEVPALLKVLRIALAHVGEQQVPLVGPVSSMQHGGTHRARCVAADRRMRASMLTLVLAIDGTRSSAFARVPPLVGSWPAATATVMRRRAHLYWIFAVVSRDLAE